jgi:hypothetical protein
VADLQDFEAGGAAGGHAGLRVLEDDGAGNGETGRGEEIRLGVGLLVRDVAAADDGVEVVADAGADHEGLDFLAGTGTHDGHFEAALKGGEGGGESAGEGRVVDHLGAEELLFFRVFGPEVVPVAIAGDHAEHFTVVDADAVVAVELPFEGDAEGAEDIAPAGPVDGLAVDEDTVEVEENGVVWAHGEGSSQRNMRAGCGKTGMKTMATPEEMQAELDRLRAENEALKKPATRGQMSLKVSEKGALSVYGLGRFPVTLYREQWEKLLGLGEEIKSFIQAHDSELKKKEQ